jgi:hypothetical protein
VPERGAQPFVIRPERVWAALPSSRRLEPTPGFAQTRADKNTIARALQENLGFLKIHGYL